MLVSMVAVLLGAIFLYLTISTPVENQGRFMVLLMITALFMPFASPNVISTVYDITLPEVRSTALSIQYFIENIGAAAAPALAGLIAIQASLEGAILMICITAWLFGAVFLGLTAYLVPTDIKTLHSQLTERAEDERAKQQTQPTGA